jgi:hypothetical protein
LSYRLSPVWQQLQNRYFGDPIRCDINPGGFQVKERQRANKLQRTCGLCGSAHQLRPYGQETHLRVQGRGVYRTEGSCRFPLIVLQQTTQSFLATHNSVIPARPSIRQWEQEPVLLALVIPLLVITCHVLLQQFV